MTVFATLLFGHLIADFPLQTNRIFRLKTRSNAGLLLHVSIHVLLLALLLVEPWRYWPVLLFLGLSHFVIDWLKVRWQTRPEWPGFLLDQLAHMAVLVIITLWQPEMVVRPMPAWLLAVGLSGVFLSAAAMFGSVLLNDLRSQGMKTDEQLTRAQRSMFQVSQRGGRLLLASLILLWVLL